MSMTGDTVAAFFERVAQGAAQITEHTSLVFEDPRAYPQESFVLALIVALVVLVLVLIVLLLIESLSAWRLRRSIGLHRRWDRLAMRWLMVLAVVLAVLAVLALVPLVPSAGALCGSCHTVGPAVEAWSGDSHSGVSCYACHARTGVVGALQAGAKGALHLWESSLGDVQVFERSCLRCHGDLYEGVTAGSIRMRHLDIIDAGYRCIVCHPTVGHAALEREPMPIVRSRMSICLRCHDGVAAPSECTTCHDGPPSDTNAAAVFGATPAPITCEGCHTADTDRRCVGCHGLVLPHPVEFMRQHARLSANDTALCARCHESAARSGPCDCHGDVNVHGTYNQWFPLHGSMARTAWPGGCRCHDNSFCLFCHDRIP